MIARACALGLDSVAVRLACGAAVERAMWMRVLDRAEQIMRATLHEEEVTGDGVS